MLMAILLHQIWLPDRIYNAIPMVVGWVSFIVLMLPCSPLWAWVAAFPCLFYAWHIYFMRRGYRV